MKILQFVQSLLPTFSKDKALDDLRITHTEIKEFTIPAYDSAVKFMDKWDFKSEVITGMFDQFKRIVKGANGDNPVITIHKSFKNILENHEQIENAIAKTYSEDEAGAGLSYKKANLLQFSECLAFVSKYARKFLVFIYVHETAQYENGGTSIADSLTKAEVLWIEANFVNFCTVLNIVSGNPSMIKRQLEDIPDIIVTEENAGTLGSTIGENKVDPFQMKFIPTWLNPIYHVGMFVAEWQAERYKEAKEELKLLQLRKLNLEKINADKDKPDAALQKEITYMETRIKSVSYKIDKMEKDK